MEESDHACVTALNAIRDKRGGATQRRDAYSTLTGIKKYSPPQYSIMYISQCATETSRFTVTVVHDREQNTVNFTKRALLRHNKVWAMNNNVKLSLCALC